MVFITLQIATFGRYGRNLINVMRKTIMRELLKLVAGLVRIFFVRLYMKGKKAYLVSPLKYSLNCLQFGRDIHFVLEISCLDNPKIVIDILIQVCYFPRSNKFLYSYSNFIHNFIKPAIFIENNFLIPFY
ncbi:MAG: hypothetical protein MAG551_00027 [Candidatus Scalindua arabica]|uniref:Uncharacterized protein n=1 Tax=Candidatus Scalindua arabica TaxID=1127984 RepID=A0A941VXS4_9BACT|nr:hypothetical protein [Candidatus Scalindua arabica]